MNARYWQRGETLSLIHIWASEARLFSAKNPKFSGVFRYAFTKSGESIPPFRGYGQEKER